MTSTWTTAQVLALAPDASSAKSGRDLGSARKWKTLGRVRDERGDAVWGELQGSGSEPYRTRIDLGEPAFKCTCPSRKFPCKHGLGLFLVLAESPASIATAEPPAWVSEWLEERRRRAEVKVAKAAAPPDAEAQAKRAAERGRKVAAGLDDLALFLRDLVRQGLGAAQSLPSSAWEQAAARLVDAQAPGVARLVREVGGAIASGEGWQDRALERLGRIHLLIEAFRRIDALPEPVRADVRAAVGFTQSHDEVLAGDGVSGRWAVLGRVVEVEERLRNQRSWLWNSVTGQPALVLHFAFGNAPLDASLAPGTVSAAEVVYFPSHRPLRALAKSVAGREPLREMPGHESAEAAVAAWSDALAGQPWLERFPMALRAVTPVRDGESWLLRDAQGKGLPLARRFDRDWELAALSGGRPIGVFGEWDGDALLPLSATAGGRFFDLSPRSVE